MVVRKVSEVESTLRLNPAATKPITPRFGDQITPAPTKQDYSPSEPQLTPLLTPPSVVTTRLIKLMNHMEAAQQEVATFGLDYMEELNIELAEKTREQLEKDRQIEKNVAGNDVTTRLISAAGAAASLTAGLYLFQDPAISKWTSGGMVTAGVGSFGALALNEAGVCPQLTAALGLAAGILGLSLGGATYNSQLFPPTENGIMASIAILARLLQGLGGARRTYSQVENVHLNNDRATVRAELSNKQRLIKESTELASNMLQSLQPMQERIYKHIHEQSRLGTQIARSIKQVA